MVKKYKTIYADPPRMEHGGKPLKVTFLLPRFSEISKARKYGHSAHYFAIVL